MRPGERIEVIKRVAIRLGSNNEEDVRLTLVQFGVDPDLRYFGDFSFDGQTSVVRSIEGASDETLSALEEFLFGHSMTASSSRRGAGASTIWNGTGLKLFISHTSANKAAVHGIAMFLPGEGVTPFVAHDDIEPSREWQDAIESALYTCDALAAYVTPDFPHSVWTNQEVGFCVARDVLIIPIRIGHDPSGFIGRVQGLQGLGIQPLSVAEQIADILLTNPRTSRTMGPHAVEAFCNSGSYAAGRKHYARVMRIPRDQWSGEMIAQTRRALETNNQISECGITGQGFLKEILPPYLDSLTT